MGDVFIFCEIFIKLYVVLNLVFMIDFVNVKLCCFDLS